MIALATVSLFLLLFYVLARLDIVQSHYANYEELVSDPLIFQKGWIPQWIPQSAVDIFEVHDLDTKDAFLFFSFSEADNFFSNCKNVSKEKIGKPGQSSSHLFSRAIAFTMDEINKNDAINFYRCDPDRLLAIDEKKYQAFVWTKEEP